MARIPQEFIDQLRERADIVEVVGSRIPLTPAGANMRGLCPFHPDTDPSLVVSPARGTWHCFGCGAGGNVFTFLMKMDGMSFPEAVAELARRYNMPLPAREMTPAQRRAMARRQQMLEAISAAQDYFRYHLATPAGAAARDYLGRRGVDPGMIEAFGLGYAPRMWEGLRRHLSSRGIDEQLAVEAGLVVPRDKGGGCYDRFRHRITIPIRDTQGRIVSFGGRALDSQDPAKYINGPDTPLFHKGRMLFNLHSARAHMRRKARAIVVEGYFDVLAMTAAGLGETVAPLGTALTPHQARLLALYAKEIVLVFDGDEAGQRAATRALGVLMDQGIIPKGLILAQGTDPDEIVRSLGPQAMARMVEEARDLLELTLEGIMRSHRRDEPGSTARVLGELVPWLRRLRSQGVRWSYINWVAARLGLPASAVAAEVDTTRPAASARRLPPPQGTTHESLLGLALTSPEAARILAQRGALGSVEGELGEVARAVEEMLNQGLEPSPAAVMDRLEQPHLHALVARIAQGTPRLSAEDAIRQASGIIEQLDRRRLLKMRRELNRQIAEAEQKGDYELVARLQQRRRELSANHLPTTTGEG